MEVEQFSQIAQKFYELFILHIGENSMDKKEWNKWLKKNKIKFRHNPRPRTNWLILEQGIIGAEFKIDSNWTDNFRSFYPQKRLRNNRWSLDLRRVNKHIYGYYYFTTDFMSKALMLGELPSY